MVSQGNQDARQVKLGIFHQNKEASPGGFIGWVNLYLGCLCVHLFSDKDPLWTLGYIYSDNMQNTPARCPWRPCVNQQL